MRSTLILLCAGSLLLAACSREPAPDAGAAAPTASTDGHAFKPDIDADDLRELVATLASDEFEGRAPGSAGEEKTVAYIQAQYERIGLEPGGDNGTWFQTVPMIETTADTSTVLRLDSNGNQRELKFGTDMVLGTRTGQEQVSVADSELVFVGYGVNAPEQGWNDYEGLDVKGKTVVVLVNDPGFHAGDESLFEGKRMTYYGRWTYKFEEAARQGAAAALIIHDTEGASYGWEVVRNSWSGPQFDLRAEDDPEPRLPAQGWITGEVARQLFAESGLDLDEQYAAANRRGFKAVPLKARVSFDLRSTVSEKSSRNVVGYLRGTEAPEETVVYLAHWDHLGRHEGEGDTIYNGAVDNATGVAGIIEIAEKFAAAPPRRSVVFLAVTLEESGLLGSKYYVAQPAFPLEKTVAVVNLDAMSVAGRSRDVVVTGKGNSELEDILAPLASAQGRVLVEESNPAGGYYFRSDHFNFVKAGVPALYAKGGGDLLEGGAAAGKAAADEYARRYHQPSDEIHDGWRWDGMVEDLELLHEVGRTLADGDQWPNWYEGNPFKAARDAARAGAQ
ncbi:M28 family metallopeptidase [Luteimonas wenzhouensis]|uniref:M28 family peptidase n=1 Tax=Luteimonas wenzhouensis TaxID=2599615 RepID=A0A5C5TVY2_9GAMM|nr:M28 family metallopeptidase [Luteimonas wenzhouensis]NLW97732.1 M28 family peptidase [Xanthomonadaceae bacterium]TWT18361.1 M28 family peptidase [Luteimonas wenzhouensis]